MQDKTINIDVSALTDQIEALSQLDGMSHGVGLVLAMHLQTIAPEKAAEIADQIDYGPVEPPTLQIDLAQQHLEEIRQALRGEYQIPDI